MEIPPTAYFFEGEDPETHPPLHSLTTYIASVPEGPEPQLDLQAWLGIVLGRVEAEATAFAYSTEAETKRHETHAKAATSNLAEQIQAALPGCAHAEAYQRECEAALRDAIRQVVSAQTAYLRLLLQEIARVNPTFNDTPPWYEQVTVLSPRPSLST